MSDVFIDVYADSASIRKITSLLETEVVLCLMYVISVVSLFVLEIQSPIEQENL